MVSPVIVWFRQDLRLRNNPAFSRAAALKQPIIAVYIDDKNDPVPAGEAGRWWLHHSLKNLQKALQKYEIPLILRQGNCQKILEDILKSTGATSVFWNRLYRSYCYERDEQIKNLLKAHCQVDSFPGNTLIEPSNLLSQSRTPYKVFSPFWKTLLKKMSSVTVHKIPHAMTGYKGKIDSEDLKSWNLERRQSLVNNDLNTYWKPGEDNAQRCWKDFLSCIDDYQKNRNFPSIDATSGLSPYLHWGEISVQQIWKDVEAHQFSAHFSEGVDFQSTSGAATFVKEIVWRDFFQYLFYHFPEMKNQPLQKKFEHFKWALNTQNLLDKWKKGLTGYPLIDAGMRQLLHSGWMHNRVRLVAASFLVKHLLVHWREGEKWFWERLVDADHGNNAGNWQWVAGCGADAAPYFRIFNPILQSQKFDSEGIYIKEWVPELKKLPKKYIHQPWKAPKEFLKENGIVLGQTYPFPIVEHEKARQHALDNYAALKKN